MGNCLGKTYPGRAAVVVKQYSRFSANSSIDTSTSTSSSYFYIICFSRLNLYIFCSGRVQCNFWGFCADLSERSNFKIGRINSSNLRTVPGHIQFNMWNGRNRPLPIFCIYVRKWNSFLQIHANHFNLQSLQSAKEIDGFTDS